MPPPNRHRALVVCPPGIEELLAAELDAHGLRRGRTVRGGVELGLTSRELYAANAWLRMATRVLVRLGSFEARSFAQLAQRAEELAWDRYVTPDHPVSFRVTSTASQLFHTEAIAERLAGVVSAPAVAASHPDPAQLIVVRVDHDRVTISVDASGEPLYKRGWRQEVARAPLRETLAAALLAAVGWDGSVPLVDPFCGAGTIPIEAAVLAAGWAPGAGRSFAFQGWPSFEPGTWGSVRAGLRPATPDRPRPVIVGRDRDAGAMAAARANAERAGVAELVRFDHGAVSDAAPPAELGGGPPGWLITNPPYGGRVGGPDLRDLYARLGQVAATRFPGWGVGVLVADPALAGHTRLRLDERLRTANGGIPVRFLATAPPRPPRPPGASAP